MLFSRWNYNSFNLYSRFYKKRQKGVIVIKLRQNFLFLLFDFPEKKFLKVVYETIKYRKFQVSEELQIIGL